MRTYLLALVIATGCAAHAPRSTFAPEYACGAAELVPHGQSLEVREASASAGAIGSTSAKLAWHDRDGDHFVAPTTPADVETVEFVVPGDARLDAIATVYDTSGGPTRPDWRAMRREVCTAHGGYSDALARFSRGESFDQLARELSLDGRDDARELVHTALISLTRRYYKER